MDITGENINLLASILANILSKGLKREEIVVLKTLLAQINCCLNTILVINSQKSAQNPTKNGKI